MHLSMKIAVFISNRTYSSSTPPQPGTVLEKGFCLRNVNYSRALCVRAVRVSLNISLVLLWGLPVFKYEIVFKLRSWTGS